MVKSLCTVLMVMLLAGQAAALTVPISRDDLRSKCSSQGSCCEAAVDAVITKPQAYPIAQISDGCKDGFKPNMNKCPSGFAWCEPVEEKK